MTARRRRAPKAKTEPLRLEYRHPDELEDNPANWKRHPARQVTALREVLADVGWAGAALFNERTGRLIDGHVRKRLARDRNEKIPVLIGSWSPEEEGRILATLDPVGEMATRDAKRFRELAKKVTAPGPSIERFLEQARSREYKSQIQDIVVTPPKKHVWILIGIRRLRQGAGDGRAPGAARQRAGERNEVNRRMPSGVRAKKIDNSILEGKILLRLATLEAAGVSKCRVLDLFAGEGVLWKELRKSIGVAEYTPCDIEPRAPGTIKGNSFDTAFLASFDLGRFNVIDVDPYGEPWIPWHVLSRRITGRTVFFLTWGHRITVNLSHYPLSVLGLPAEWLGDLPQGHDLTMLAGQNCLALPARWCNILTAKRVQHQGKSYYGLVVEPKKKRRRK